MIRCKKCGHKLKDNQTICDICNTPVSAPSEDFELEEELAKSIAKIVENETTDAQVYLKQIQGTLDKSESMTRKQEMPPKKSDVLGVSQRGSVPRSQESTVRKSVDTASRPVQKPVPQKPKTSAARSSVTRPDTVRTENVRPADSRTSAKKKKKNNKAGKIAAIVIAVILAFVVIVGLAFYTINMIFTRAQDNFAYYNNIGVEYVQAGNYEDAIPYLQQALTYSEADGKVNVRFTLYDCYAAVGDTERAITLLYSILEIDTYNLEAIVDLQGYYEAAGSVDALKDMYERYKDTEASAAVSKYFVEEPKISVEGGKYTEDLAVMITSDYDFDIYYTTDGSDPTTSSRKYSRSFTIEEGETTLKCIAVNEYGISSGIVQEEYSITYENPKAATVSPVSGTYTSEQLIVIGNIPVGGNAYYTIDNTVPTNRSTLYEGPFDMPSGNFVLSVIIYDRNGLASSVTKRNYVLNLQDRVSEAEAMSFVWNAMEEKNMVDEHHLSSEGEPVSLQYYNRITVDGITLWVYDIIVSTEAGDLQANYRMGADTEQGFVYTVYENNGIFTLDQVQY